MISSLSGRLVRKSPTEAVLEVHGVSYAISIPLSTFEALGDLGTSITLQTHLVVREDSLLLYGFSTEQEKEMFRLLISVSGIGPKMAQMILSGSRVDDLRGNISSGNLVALTAIQGIGKKLGERLLLELRDKVGRLTADDHSAGLVGQAAAQSEAVLALISLGYSKPAAEKAVRTVSDGSKQSLEDIIKAALKVTSK